MADSISEFARRALEALKGEKAPPKREPRKAEVIEPTTARALEVALTRPEYGHMYDASGKDLGVARAMDEPRSAPNKAGDTMSGPRGKVDSVGGRAAQTVHEKPTVVGPARDDVKYMPAPPTGMQGARNQAAPAPSGQEWDENGNPIHPYVRGPITVDNAWDQITSAPADYLVAHGYVLPPDKQAALGEKIDKTKAATEKWAGGQLQRTMKQVREQPGGEYGAQKGLEFAQGAQSKIGQIVDAVQPKERDISSITREFSNEEDKKRYIEERKAAK